MSQHNGSSDFRFLEGEWHIQNKRRQVNLLTTDPNANKEYDWQEFPAKHTGQVLIPDRVLLDRYEATFPNGVQVIGISVRAYDEETGQWSIIWLDNRQPPDFRPLLGQFEDGIGLFDQVIETPDGRPLYVRFTWDNLSENTARWRQDFSLDGQTWDTNWVMDFTR